jgi:CSLREA domain-containing protein
VSRTKEQANAKGKDGATDQVTRRRRPWYGDAGGGDNGCGHNDGRCAAHAFATFTVNLPGDTRDANTGDGKCDVNLLGTGEQCTLRAAIEQANATSGADAIRLDTPDDFGVGVKTVNVGATGNGALPTITEQVSIDGYPQPGRASTP